MGETASEEEVVEPTAAPTAKHIEDAQGHVEKAEQTAPSDAIKQALDSINEALGTVKNSLGELGEGIKKLAEKPDNTSEPASAAPAEVDAKVETPEKQFRYVRRAWGRKVKREV